MGKLNGFKEFAEKIDTLFSKDENQYKDAALLTNHTSRNLFFQNIKKRLINTTDKVTDLDG